MALPVPLVSPQPSYCLLFYPQAVALPTPIETSGSLLGHVPGEQPVCYGPLKQEVTACLPILQNLDIVQPMEWKTANKHS